MSSTPSDWRERTALAWQRSGLALAVVAALMLRNGTWAEIAAAAALAAAGALTARRQIGCRALALVTCGAALVAAVTVVVTG
ncbi:MAG TPA: hypothetical protein VH418_14025 [Solirubrobacteraceae bacterium]|jgi:hypothetical protein